MSIIQDRFISRNCSGDSGVETKNCGVILRLDPAHRGRMRRTEVHGAWLWQCSYPSVRNPHVNGW
jgi:hypothetical protein